MPRQTSISSRIAWSALAAMILVATCFIGFKVLPSCEGVFARMRMPLPGFTRLVFATGPVVLLTMGIISGALMVLGEFKPVVRRVREPFGLLVMLLAISALAAMFLPRFKCGEIINPRASTGVHTAEALSAP